MSERGYDGVLKGTRIVKTGGIADLRLGEKKIDSIDFNYTGSDVTSLVYKDADGNAVFTLTLTWTSGNLTKIERS